MELTARQGHAATHPNAHARAPILVVAGEQRMVLAAKFSEWQNGKHKR